MEKALSAPNAILHGLAGLVRDSGLLVAGRLLGTAASFLFLLLLARTLAPHEVGAFLSVVSAAFLASVVVTLNIEAGSIRFLASARANARADVMSGVIFIGRAVLVIMSPLVVGGFLLGFFHWGGKTALQFPLLLLLVAAAIPIMGWLRLSASHATALCRPLKGSLPRSAVQPFLLLLIYAAVWAVGAVSLDVAALSFLAAFAAAAFLQFSLLRKSMRGVSHKPRNISDWRQWTAHGICLSPVILLQENLQHTVILIATLSLDVADIAVLGVALRFVAIIRFGVMAVNMVASPRISAAMASGASDEAVSQLRSAALVRIAPAAFASIAIFAFAAPVLSLFGAEYARGAGALAWFLLIPLSAAILGPNQLILNIAGERRAILIVSCFALLALAIAIPAGASAAGLNGAAAAAALVYVSWEAALFHAAKIKVGLDASIFSVFSIDRKLIATKLR